MTALSETDALSHVLTITYDELRLINGGIRTMLFLDLAAVSDMGADTQDVIQRRMNLEPYLDKMLAVLEISSMVSRGMDAMEAHGTDIEAVVQIPPRDFKALQGIMDVLNSPKVAAAAEDERLKGGILEHLPGLNKKMEEAAQFAFTDEEIQKFGSEK